jgi:hypothetical protein
MTEEVPQRAGTNTVAITAIIVAGIIILACIVGFVLISAAFFLNAPWL